MGNARHTSIIKPFLWIGSQYETCDSVSLLVGGFCDVVLAGPDIKLAPMTRSEDGGCTIRELNAVMRWFRVSIIMFAYNLSKRSTKGVLQYRKGCELALVTMRLARTKAITEIAKIIFSKQLDIASSTKSVATHLLWCQFQVSNVRAQLKSDACPAIEYLVSVAVLINKHHQPTRAKTPKYNWYLRGMSSWWQSRRHKRHWQKPRKPLNING